MREATPQQPRSAGPAESSIRETLESIVIAFVLAFVFRAFVVEAFVIPTGSMAPTLLGQHYRLRCPMCGYRFPMGTANGRRFAQLRDPVSCPMCRYSIRRPEGGPRAGDRILVLKYVYAFTEPERWDVVVFKNPQKPDQNYIKRLIGLPNEQLWIVAGNVFTRPLDADGTPPPDSEPWHIRRKPPDVQRAVWLPVYHSDYYPLDADRRGWSMPWQPAGPGADRWSFHPRGPRWSYPPDADEPGTLRFAFDQLSAHNLYPYNALGGGRHAGRMIGDLRIAADVMPHGTGGRVTASLTIRDRRMRARIEPDGTAVLETRSRRGDSGTEAWTVRAEVPGRPLPAGRAARLELWHADQALSLWVNGRRRAHWTYETDAMQLAQQGPPDRPPEAALRVQGPAFTLRSVNLDRDLYHTQQRGKNRYQPDGEPIGTPPLATANRPAVIGEDRFFCLGDNSPESKDGRLWQDVNPWVKHVTGVRTGYVPRDLMIGKAFFVYFPAPWPVKTGAPALIPNFGAMRFIE